MFACYTSSLLLLAASTIRAACAEDTQSTSNYQAVCAQISHAISSSSALFWPTSSANSSYAEDILHWAISSTQDAACSVEPGTAEDVGAILQILGRTRTPFAVKGGGHAMNVGFSSTDGVQIAMSRFNSVIYDAISSTANIGAGLVWDEVYDALAPYSVNVLGGRVSGVGVAGLLLGGGYAWTSNEYGLALDNVLAYELVLPTGEVITVDHDSYPDLFWGLKGGFNNFGIITKFTLKTHPQGEIWGGVLNVSGAELPAANNATINYWQTVTDPKAAILPTYNYGGGSASGALYLFYDSPTPPAGIFDEFLAIPAESSTVQPGPFTELILPVPLSSRGFFHTVSLLGFTDKIMDALVNETVFWGDKLTSVDPSVFLSYDIEPFLPSLYSHVPADFSAYPPDRSQPLMPLNIYYTYDLESADEVMNGAARQSAAHLTAVAVSEGQDVANASLYGNYALAGTDVSRIFGKNLGRLRETKAVYDPEDVMGLAGGWKV